MRRARGWLGIEPFRRALVVLASTLGTILLVDVALLLIKGPVRVVENFYEPHPTLGYRMQPHIDFVFASRKSGFRASVHTNALGLRDDELAVPKPRSSFRILMLGDSMTAGLEVARRNTFAELCQRELSGAGEVEVVNCGVRGYNLDNIVAFFETTGAALEPDLVVYTFADNDLTADTVPRPNQVDASRGLRFSGAFARILCFSHLASRLEILRQTLSLRRATDGSAPPSQTAQVTVPAGLHYMFLYSQPDLPAYRLTAERMRRLAALANQTGAEVLLAGAPHRAEVDPEAQAWWQKTLSRGQTLDFDGVRRFLAQAAAEHGLAYCDPIPAFRRELGSGTTFWFPGDTHLNNRGHALFAEQLTAAIMRTPSFQNWRARAAARPQTPQTPTP